MISAACKSDERASLSSAPAPGAVGASIDAAIRNDASQALSVWRGRVDGHTVSYLVTIECDRCDGRGTFRITEANGTVTDVVPMGGASPLRNPDQWSLSTVLVIASQAKGPVEIDTGSAQGRISIRVDPDPNVGGDDFSYTVSDITGA